MSHPDKLIRVSEPRSKNLNAFNNSGGRLFHLSETTRSLTQFRLQHSAYTRQWVKCDSLGYSRMVPINLRGVTEVKHVLPSCLSSQRLVAGTPGNPTRIVQAPPRAQLGLKTPLSHLLISLVVVSLPTPSVACMSCLLPCSALMFQRIASQGGSEYIFD